MKIVMLTPDCQMIDRRILLEAKSLVNAGHELTLLAGFECQRQESYAEEGVRIHRLQYDWDDELLKKIRRKLPQNDKLRMFVNRAYMSAAGRFFEISPFDRFMMTRAMEFDADVYHVHDLPCLKAGYFAAKKKNVRLVYDAHELYYAQEILPPATRKQYFKLEKKYIRYPDAVITVNPFIARLMAERYNVKEPDVIMNCTDKPKDFRPEGAAKKLRSKGSIPESMKVVLYQGWISPERNIETLVRGVKWFPEDTCLALIGYGEYEKKLRQIAEEEKTGKKVFFLGAVPNEEILNYTAGADIGVIPYLPIDDNHLYCSPNKFFEYIIAGVPVVTADLPFFRMMNEKYGAVVTTDMASPQAFGETVKNLVSGKNRLSEVKSNCAKAAFELNWDREKDKLHAIYRKIEEKIKHGRK